MELDLALGLPTATAGHGDSTVHRPDLERAGSDGPLRLAAAMAETPPPVRARMRRRPVDTEDQDVPAPPANRRPKPPSMAPSPQVRVPGAAGDRSPRASQLGFFRGMFPPAAPGGLAAAGHAQVHAMAMSAPPPLLGVSAPVANGFGRPPPFAGAWPIFEGSPAASSSNPNHPTAPMTIFYAGSVRAFDGVPVEQAEKILYMTAKEAQATETPAFQQPQPAAAFPILSSQAQMMTLLGLANANNDSLLPKRTASLVRFLHKRKQRVETAATMSYPRGEAALPVPAQMDTSTAVYARDKAPSWDIEQPWGTISEDGPKSMEENHGEETVNTDLKI